MNAPKATHACPVPDCGVAGLAYDRMMCAYHWALVPRPTRLRVYAHWRRGGPDHLYPHIRREAIEAAMRAEVGG